MHPCAAFLVGSEGNPVYVAVEVESVRIFVEGFDEGCASCSVAHFRSSDLDM